MIKTVSATYARAHFYEMLDHVSTTHEPMIITLRGKAVAAMISHADYMRYLAKGRYPDIASLSGAAGKLKRPMSWKKIKEAIRDERAKKVMGALRQSRGK
jgi:prevent-host-death family protein